MWVVILAPTFQKRWHRHCLPPLLHGVQITPHSQIIIYSCLTQKSISKALIHYLYQTILMEQYPTLPDTAQKAWAQVAEKEFYSDKDKDNYISFIPFPAENIVKDNTPNSWKQPELLAIITDYFKKTFS